MGNKWRNELGLQQEKYELSASTWKYGAKAQKRGWAGGRKRRQSCGSHLCRCKLKTWERETKDMWGQKVDTTWTSVGSLFLKPLEDRGS